MKSAFATLATLALFASGALAQFAINTPTNVVVCQPILLTWTEGTPPYFLSILPGNQPEAPALVDLGQQTGTSVTWIANIAAGTSIGLSLRDSSGKTVQSAPFTINSGSDTSCVGKNPSSTPGGSTAPSTGAATSGGSAATTPATTPAATPATTTAPAGTSKPAGPSSAASATSASATGSKNAAPSQVAQMGAAGFVGAAVMALLA